ncbi:MAG: hypothetical protein ABSB33_14035 [Tepidisphaeraceae bacterium]|jgi:hypothetical protein
MAADATPNPTLMIDAAELGRQICCGSTTIKKMVRCGKLPLRRYRLCRKWLFSRGELEAWIAAGMPCASRWSFLKEQAAMKRTG